MSDSRHIMLAIGLFLATLVLGGMTLVMPNAREVREIRVRVADLQQRSEGVDQTAIVVEQLTEMVDEAQRRIDSELKVIPDEPGVASMIRQLSLPIDGVNVVDQTFSVGNTFEPLPESHPSIQSVPVTMEMSATFDSTYAVLRSIETMDRMIRMRSVRLRATDGRLNRHDEPVIQIVLVIEVLFEQKL